MKKFFRGFIQIWNESLILTQKHSKLSASRNKETLYILSNIFTAVLAIYLLLSVFVFKSGQLTVMYLIVLPVQILYDIYLYRHRKDHPDPKKTERQILVLYICVMAFITVVSIYPFTGRPGIYFATVLICMTIPFTVSMRFQVISVSVSAITYIVLASIFKDPVAADYDRYMTLAGYAAALLTIYTLTVSRLREDNIRKSLIFLSETDSMTGLYNKTAFELKCRDYLRENAGKKCAVFMMDIDNFKIINDTAGHQAGDEILVDVAKRLRNCFREEDIASRFGGDEFLVLMKDISCPEDAVTKAERLRQSIMGNGFRETKEKVSCSIGICINLAPSADYDTLLKKADYAMYEAKKSGKNQYFTVQNKENERRNEKI